MERDDDVWFFCAEANEIKKVTVRVVDPIRMKVFVEVRNDSDVEGKVIQATKCDYNAS